MLVKTVFEFEKETYTVEATGQEAVLAIKRELKTKYVKLLGFLIDGIFKPVDLSDHWLRPVIKCTVDKINNRKDEL